MAALDGRPDALVVDARLGRERVADRLRDLGVGRVPLPARPDGEVVRDVEDAAHGVNRVFDRVLLGVTADRAGQRHDAVSHADSDRRLVDVRIVGERSHDPALELRIWSHDLPSCSRRSIVSPPPGRGAAQLLHALAQPAQDLRAFARPAALALARRSLSRSSDARASSRRSTVRSSPMTRATRVPVRACRPPRAARVRSDAHARRDRDRGRPVSGHQQRDPRDRPRAPSRLRRARHRRVSLRVRGHDGRERRSRSRLTPEVRAPRPPARRHDARHVASAADARQRWSTRSQRARRRRAVRDRRQRHAARAARARATSSRAAARASRVVAVPKTIDDDIAYVDKTFGFDTAVEHARAAIDAAHAEALVGAQRRSASSS